MTKTLLFFALFLEGCEGCGYTSVDNKMAGQVKKVHHNTPIICPDYDSADVSLGIMQNGVGSISTHDVQMTVPGKAELDVFKEAALTGKLVEVEFKERRVTLCIDDYVVTAARFLDEGLAKVVPALSEQRTVSMTLNGHKIDAVVVGRRVTTLKLDGVSTAIDSPAGKAAADVVLNKDLLP